VEITETLSISPDGSYNHLAALYKEGYRVKKDERYELDVKFVNGDTSRRRPLQVTG
jgi:predicted transcriptional regulator